MSTDRTQVLTELEQAKTPDGLRQAAADLSTLSPDEWRSVAASFQADQAAHKDLPNITFNMDANGEQSANFHIAAEHNSPERLVVSPKK